MEETRENVSPNARSQTERILAILSFLFAISGGFFIVASSVLLLHRGFTPLGASGALVSIALLLIGASLSAIAKTIRRVRQLQALSNLIVSLSAELADIKGRLESKLNNKDG